MGLEISQKVKQVFPPFGGEGGVQSNWHYSGGGVQNSLMKRLANFEIAKSKTLGVMAHKKKFESLIREKKKKNKSKCVQRTLVAPLTVFYFSKYTKSLPHETMNDIEWPCTIEIQSFLYQMTDIPDRPQSIY